MIKKKEVMKEGLDWQETKTFLHYLKQANGAQLLCMQNDIQLEVESREDRGLL